MKPSEIVDWLTLSTDSLTNRSVGLRPLDLFKCFHFYFQDRENVVCPHAPLIGKTKFELRKERALASQNTREEREKVESGKRFRTVGKCKDISQLDISANKIFLLNIVIDQQD